MKIIYLETSTINKLFKDPNCNELTSKLKRYAIIRTSYLNILEIASTKNNDMRINLLRFAYDILDGDPPLDNTVDYLDKSLFAMLSRDESFVGNFEGFNWDLLFNLKSSEDNIYKMIVKEKNDKEKQYRNMHNQNRDEMLKIIDGKPPSEQVKLRNRFSYFIHEFFQKLFKDILIKRIENKNIEITDSKYKFIIKNLQSWRFMIAGMLYGIYKCSVQRTGFSWRRNPGSIDTQQAIYLTACDIFVTDDKPQYNMLRLVIKFGHRNRLIWKYNCFKEWINNLL